MPLEQSTAAEVVEPKKQIYGKIFTVEWLLNSLKKNDKIYQQLHSDKIVKDVTFYDVSGGKGFLSAILRCTVHFANTNDVYSTILKIPGLEAIKKASKTLEMNKKDSSEAKESGNKKYEAIEDSHKFECDFYNNLAPLLDIPCPKVYQTLDFKVGEKEGVIHMEDLTLRGKTITYFENINLTQIKCVIQHLAHMHYRVLKCIDQNEWRGKYLKKQEAMETITKNFDLMFKPLLKSSQREESFEPFIKRLHKFYTNLDFAIYSTKQAYIDLGMAPVLVHGDLHAGNIMWAIDDEGNIQNEVAAFIDWQIIHEGSPMSDIARFLTHCCNGVVRRQAETFAVKYYYECLVKEFEDVSEIPYTNEQLKKAYNYAFLKQAFNSIAIIQMLFLAIPEKDGNDAIKNAFHDCAVQKALHLFEDADSLLQGEMKDIFEKYGV